MTPRTYASPEAFKQALEQRLRASSKTGAEFARKRQLLVFDRFLARVVALLGDAATLKGGLVLEMRLERARTTKDVDLRLLGSSDSARLRWHRAADVENLPDRDARRREAPCVHDAARATELPREGSAGYRAARIDPSARRRAPADSHRADIHVSKDARTASLDAATHPGVAGSLRGDGAR